MNAVLFDLLNKLRSQDIYSIIRFYVSEEYIFSVNILYGTCFLKEKVMDVTYAKIFAIVIL